MSLEAISKLRNKNHQETKERRTRKAKGLVDVMSTPGHRIFLNQTLGNWRNTQVREQWLSKVETQLEGNDIESLYKELWGNRTTVVQPLAKKLESGGEARELETLMPAVSTQEINKLIKRLKKDTAPGPDGIKKAHITSRTTLEILRLYFNLVLVSKTQPTEWRQNRTRLLLKEGKDSQRAENYRPVTIGSLLNRLYWGLMDERLRSEVRLTPRQKGFVSEDGCFNNVHTLNEIMKLAKKGDGRTIVQLDISKAFDTVPHEEMR
jgi:hypothetical protein